jgi:hypothetical protein
MAGHFVGKNLGSTSRIMFAERGLRRVNGGVATRTSSVNVDTGHSLDEPMARMGDILSGTSWMSIGIDLRRISSGATLRKSNVYVGIPRGLRNSMARVILRFYSAEAVILILLDRFSTGSKLERSSVYVSR